MQSRGRAICGYIGLLGLVLIVAGVFVPGDMVGQILITIGVVLKGADSLGHILSA